MDRSLLYYGDNLDVLRRHIKAETVDLCYIDPPFNSKRNYNQIYNNIGKEDMAQAMAFVDKWEWDTSSESALNEILTNEHKLLPMQAVNLIFGLNTILGKGSMLAYLVSMTLRIAEIHRALKPTGSFYLHCDPTASHYLKLVLDAVFCSQGGEFLNEIIWCYRGAGYPKKDFGRRHDVIFRYAKNENDYVFNLDLVREPYAEATKERFKHYIGNKRKGKDFGEQALNPLGKHPDDWWQIQPIAPSSKERLGYPTQKPIALLERIIQASSDEGDVVLDAYCGCGTTVAAAQKLNRKWIGIDITYQSISLIIKRLTDTHGTKIMDSITVNGIPKDLESAKALARKADDKTRKEFEKWAVLTYSANKAMVNEKKGKDGGIDGRQFIVGSDGKHEWVLFSVKSGKVNAAMVRDFRGTIEREQVVMGIFITLNNPTKDMKQEAATAGTYKNEQFAAVYDKIKIVTVEQILAGERLHLPSAVSVLKAAQKADQDDHEQIGL
jgi:site-specific DNA-methyltransferase (adenine-specific)